MATAISIATVLLALVRAQKESLSRPTMVGYKGDDSRGNPQRQVAGDTGNAYAMDGGSQVDELFFNNTGSAIASGTWVADDLTVLNLEELNIPGRLGAIGLPDQALIRRMKAAVPGDPAPVRGVLLEAVAAEAWGRVRRKGMVVPALHGVTPLLDSATLAQGTVRELTISGSNAGQAAHALRTLRGTLEVLDGADTGTVSVGTSYNGKPAIACLSEADGVITVLHAIVAAGTLTVTLSDITNADRTVSYVVFGSDYDRVVGYQVGHQANYAMVLVDC